MYVKKLLPKTFISILKKNYYFFLHLKFRILLNLFRLLNKEIKIIIGAGRSEYKSWISTEYQFLDISNIDNLKKYFKKEEVSKILAEHVFEHLTLEEGIKSIKNLKYILNPKGTIRIAVPDGYNPNKEYINLVKPGGAGDGADDHKVLYNYLSIKELFDDDFEIKFLEYFNEKKKFVYNSYNNDEINGFIKRSRFNDERNTIKKINYNSIILEAKKLY